MPTTNIRFCQYLLVEARKDARRKGVKIPKGLTALRSDKTWFFVESRTSKGEFIEADNAYDAKAKYIFKLCDSQVPSEDE